MNKTAFRIHMAMVGNKKEAKKKDVQNLVAVPTADFDEAWNSLRKRRYILRTKSKGFVLNGTTLAARMNLEGRLAS